MGNYEVVLEHLKKYGEITTWEAFIEYHITRLSEYIRQIRIDYVVDDEWLPFINKREKKSQYKKYIFKGKKTY